MSGTARKTVEEVSAAPTSADEPSGKGFRIDLFRLIPGLHRLVRMRSFQFLVILPNLAVFYLFFMTGFLGTPVGNRNIIIIFVWILWWFLLIAVMVPFASRIWCTVCPLVFFGEWFQRGALIMVRPGKSGGLKNRMFGLHKRWPKKLTNIWLQNIGFLSMCTFSALMLTRPIVSAGVFVGMIVVGIGLAVIYRLRVFCNYVCPVSGFLSLYSMASMIELRSRDDSVCKKCKSKACRVGNDDGWGCPWFLYMGKLDRNNYCGLCMECVKSCPNDNIALNLRPFAVDTRIKGYDEAFKGFIMLALAMAYSVILLGPYGTIKDWANAPESGQWGGFLIYAAILWGSALVVLPAFFYVSIWLARRFAGANEVELKQVFLGYAFILIPLGLLAWIAFSVPLLFVNGTYILNVLSDPFGWGWDLFGTANLPWTPVIPESVIYIQMPLLAVGLGYSLKRAYQAGLVLFGTAQAAIRGLVPIGTFATVITLGFLVFFGG